MNEIVKRLTIVATTGIVCAFLYSCGIMLNERTKRMDEMEAQRFAQCVQAGGTWFQPVNGGASCIVPRGPEGSK